MPRRDKTGPFGKGPMTGKGAGNCAGSGQGRGVGGGRGRGFGSGRGGYWSHPASGVFDDDGAEAANVRGAYWSHPAQGVFGDQPPGNQSAIESEVSDLKNQIQLLSQKLDEISAQPPQQ